MLSKIQCRFGRNRPRGWRGRCGGGNSLSYSLQNERRDYLMMLLRFMWLYTDEVWEVGFNKVEKTSNSSNPSFTQVSPQRSLRATRRDFRKSSVHMAPPKPYCEALANSTASSSVSNLDLQLPEGHIENAVFPVVFVKPCFLKSMLTRFELQRHHGTKDLFSKGRVCGVHVRKHRGLVEMPRK